MKKIGPGEVNLTSNAVRSMTGDKKDDRGQRDKNVDRPLDREPPEIRDCRVVADERIAVEFIAAMTGFLKIKDVGQEANDDALLFARGRNLRCECVK